MNALEIENDETENCEALTVKLISSAKGKTSEHQRGTIAVARRTEVSVAAGRVRTLGGGSATSHHFQKAILKLAASCSLRFLKFPQDYHFEEQ